MSEEFKKAKDAAGCKYANTDPVIDIEIAFNAGADFGFAYRDDEVESLKMEASINANAARVSLEKNRVANERIVEFEDIKRGHLEVQETFKQRIEKLRETIEYGLYVKEIGLSFPTLRFKEALEADDKLAGESLHEVPESLRKDLK